MSVLDTPGGSDKGPLNWVFSLGFGRTNVAGTGSDSHSPFQIHLLK